MQSFANLAKRAGSVV